MLEGVEARPHGIFNQVVNGEMLHRKCLRRSLHAVVRHHVTSAEVGGERDERDKKGGGVVSVDNPGRIFSSHRGAITTEDVVPVV